MPVVAATGSRCPGLDAALRPAMTAAAETQFIAGFDILDFADFTAIENALLARKANLMLGNSDGRRIEERRHIPLLRYGFPIHDQVGGQRTRLLLYDGSLSLMEATANAMLRQTESAFRQELYNKYYKDTPAALLPSVMPTGPRQPHRLQTSRTAPHPAPHPTPHAPKHTPVLPAGPVPARPGCICP